MDSIVTRAGRAFCLVVMGLGLLAPAFAAPTKKPAAKKTPDFAASCGNAWVKAVTKQDPSHVAIGEDVTFSFTLEGVTNAVPKDLLYFQWKRTGDDGVTEEGRAPIVSKKAFAYTTKSEKSGAIRLNVQVVGKDGKPFLRPGSKAPIRLSAGALVAPEQIEPRTMTSAQERFFKSLTQRLKRVNFKKYPRTPQPCETMPGISFFRIDLPSPTQHPLKGLLAIPKAAMEGTQLPARLRFWAGGYEKEVPLPKPQEVRANEVVFTITYDAGKAEARDEAFCGEIYLEVARALQYVKSLPEWNGKSLVTEGSQMNALLAFWAAATGEGVTSVSCSLLPTGDLGALDPQRLAPRIPSTCRLTIPRAGLGDAGNPPTALVGLWNALSCERTLTWIQGAEGWGTPRNFKGRDTVWEKLTPVRYLRLDEAHAHMGKGTAKPYADMECALTDRVVLEVLFDYTKKTSVGEDLVNAFFGSQQTFSPLTVYLAVADKKIKDKQWSQFLSDFKKNSTRGGSIPFPLYLDAGMDLPPPDMLPWFHVVDKDGVLRYSGNSLGAAVQVARRSVARMPKRDPLFACAKPVLLKEMVEKLQKGRNPLSGQKLYKAIEAEMKKVQRSKPDLAAEARHLLIGMRQALEERIFTLRMSYSQRPGKTLMEMAELLADWPELASHPSISSMKAKVEKNADLAKLMKMEKELAHFHAWQPEKKAEVRKKEQAIEMFRKKVEKLTKSPAASIQGEAQLILVELDNPPQQAAQQN